MDGWIIVAIVMLAFTVGLAIGHYAGGADARDMAKLNKKLNEL